MPCTPFGKIARYDKSSVEITSVYGFSHVIRRREKPVDAKHQTLSESGNEVTALRCGAVIHNAEPQVFEIRIQRNPEKNDVQSRRNDQHDYEAPIPPDLVQFLHEE